MFAFRKFWDLFLVWLSSAQGTAAIAALWGLIMGSLTYFTNAIADYAPLSYGLSVAIGIVVGLIICRQFHHLLNVKFTNKPTFVEYRMENGRINLIKKSNIYGEPGFNLNISLVEESSLPSGMIPRTSRNIKQLQKKHPPVLKEHDLKTASLNVVFDRPISDKFFHVHLVKGAGNCPVKLNSTINNRAAVVELANIANDCSFTVWFSEEKK